MKQYTLLTANGINKILKTASDGSKIILKEIAVSDFEGELSEQTTSIPNEKYRGAINAVTIDENDNNILDVDAVIPPEVGGFYIKTAGIYCDDGSLFAVARLADTYKPLLAEGSSKDITLNFKLQIANANKSIVLKVDNNVVLATRKWCENSFLKKTDKIDAYTKRESDDKFALKSDITDATETKAGITKLKNSITGNAEDTAITEKAVREFASGVIQKQENGYQKLPSGLMVQWGSYPMITAGQSKDINLPIAFPTAGVFCSANDSSDAGNLAVMLCKFKSNARIKITNDNSANTGDRNVSGQWFAIGY